MRKTKHRVLSCVAMMIASLAAGRVFAQAQPAREMPPDPYDPQPASDARQNSAPVHPATKDFPSAEVQAVPPAFARTVELRWTREQSRRDLSETVNRLREDFEHSSELQTAIKSQQSAHERFTAARTGALNEIRRDIRYTTLRKLAADTQRRIESLQSQTPKPDADTIHGFADLRLEYSTRATALEVDALAADSAYVEARQRLVDAALQVRLLRDDFERKLRRNTEFVTARTVLNQLNIAYLTNDAYYQKAVEARNIALTYAYWLHRYDQYRYTTAYYPYSYYDSYRNPTTYRAGYYQYTNGPAYPWMRR